MAGIIVPKFPEIYIPTWREMEVGVGAKIGGELMWELIDTRSFNRPVVVRKGKQKNMILGKMIDYWMKTTTLNTNYLGALNSGKHGHVRYCVLGTGTSAPARDQIALDSQIGSDKSFQTHSASPDFGVYGVYTETTYEFQEDECNGDLTEWGIKPSLTTPGSLLCRELFRDENGDPVVLTKTDSQVLRMTYRLYAQRVSDYSESIVTCGETTYTCKGYMTDKMLAGLLGCAPIGSVIVMQELLYMQPLWYQITRVDKTVILGTSNAASLPSDGVGPNVIKADRVTLKSSLAPSLSNYVDGSYERELIWSFAGNEANMNIGEIAFLSNFTGTSSATDYKTFTRVTFDPVIVKDSSKKLKIGVKLAITL
jgi:hypothetical protein